MRLSALFFAFLVTALPASAAPVTIGNLTIDIAWTRATPPGAPTAGGYLTIVNHGTDADTLVSVTTAAAGDSSLHMMEMKDGVMTMRALDAGIPIPAGGTVTLAPDGLHIMFMSLAAPLVKDQDVPASLTFAKAGKVDVMFHVFPIGSRGPEAAGGMDMGGMDMGGNAMKPMGQ